MLIPNYIQLTENQYTQLIQSEPDDAVTLVFTILESGTTPVTDIDTAWEELSTTLPTGAPQHCLAGTTQLADDPMLFASSPEQVAAYAPALAELDPDNDALTTLQDFYTNAANHHAAIAVIFN